MVPAKCLMTAFLGSPTSTFKVSSRFDVPVEGSAERGWKWADGMAMELRPVPPEMSARGGTNVYWSANAVVDPAVMLRRFTKHAGDFNALNRPDDETIELPHIVLHEELVASWIQGNQLYEIASLLKCPYMVGVPKKKPKGPRTHIGLTNVLGKDTRAYRGLAVIEVGEKNITSIIFQGETVSDLLGVFNYFIKWVLMDGYQSED